MNSKLIQTALIAGVIALTGCASQQHPAAPPPGNPVPPVAPIPNPIVEVNATNFEQEVLHAKEPVVLMEFYASWCSICQREAPILEEVAKDYGGRVKFVKIDIDTSPEIAQAVHISRIPTILVVKLAAENGVGHVGFLDKDALKQLIEEGIDAKPQLDKKQ